MKFAKFSAVAAIVVGLAWAGISALARNAPGLATIVDSLAAGERLAGDGAVVTESREVGSFGKIEVDSVGKIVIKKGDTRSVSVTLDGNLLPAYETVAKDGTLRLGFKSGTSVTKLTSLVVEVVTPELSGLDVSGAAEIEFERFSSESFALSMSGAGSLSGAIDAGTLWIESSGAAKIALEGKAGKLEIEVSGVANLDMSSLVADDCAVQVSGAGTVTLHAVSRLAVEIAGAATVRYHGAPSITKSVAGVGSVVALDD
jgi:hypothetical protein